MRRAGMLVIGLFVSATAVSAQSPAPPSHVAVDQAIDRLHETLKGPIPGGAEAAPGWRDFLGSIKTDLAAYVKAGTFADRSNALSGLRGSSSALSTIAWPPAEEVRTALDAWVEPRLRIVSAVETLRARLSEPAESEQEATNRKGWLKFLDDHVGDAVKSYESAATVQARVKALEKLGETLGLLEKASGWAPSVAVTEALRGSRSIPNFDVTADVAALAKQFARDVVQSGPVERRGYVSQVTAGPNLGFGLFASDEGIGFYNAQAYSNYTPIWDFQNQMQQDPRGQRITKLYSFAAASVDSPTLTAMSLITPSGLRLWPQFTHNADLLVGSAKVPGKGLQRGILGLIGMNQGRINQKVYENAVGGVRSNIEREAYEESSQRMAQAEVEQNAKLSEVLVGNRTAVVKDFAITELEMRSRPDHAFVGGRIGWRGAAAQFGAEMPQPPRLNTIEAGVAADVNLGSILTNLAGGVWGQSPVSQVKTLLVETRPLKPGEKAADGLTLTKDATFEDFSKAVAKAQAVKEGKAQAIFVRKPAKAPTFGTDARGNLVVLITDFQLDVPVPPALAALTNNARILRIHSPLAEFVLGVEAQPGDPVRIAANVKEFHPGPGTKVLTIQDDESKATSLDLLRTPLILAGFGRALSAVPISAPLDQLKIPGYELKSVSPLDPTGWMRVILAPAETVLGTEAETTAGE